MAVSVDVVDLAFFGRVASASATETAPDSALRPSDPLAGVAGERAFIRAADNGIVLMPAFRLQVGAGLFPRGEPKGGFFLRKARVEMSGWLGPDFYFNVGGDFAGTAGAFVQLPGDAYVAFAPAEDLFIVQAGQFDAPFTLENRTLETETTFIERSLAIRSIAAPRNKEVGVMVHGADSARFIYYSGGVFNGDGPGLRNPDNQADLIGRVVLSPLARTSFDSLRAIGLGGSVWYGQHLAGLPFPTQTTAGGFVVLDPRWTTGRDAPVTLEMRERGKMMAFAGELSVPIGHVFGVRAEGVFKQQDLAEDSIDPATGSTMATLGRAKLKALGGYAEAWVWLLGDDLQLPRPGLQLPIRLGRLAPPTRRHALQLAVRGDLLKEDLVSTQPVLGNPHLATTRITSGALAVNYWYGRRVRVSMNYVLASFAGTTENVKTLAAAGKYEHELLFLAGMNL
jgi:hypothetical protein